MQQKPMPILEARVNMTGADDACCSCGRRKERMPGLTETYIVGTQRWVCADCARCIDSELASFAYDPGRALRIDADLASYNSGYPPVSKQRFKLDCVHDCFGVCPECGRCDDYRNIGRAQWFFCERHGLKWCAGWNILSGWRDENGETWWQNSFFLERFRDCHPCYPEPNLWERLVSTLSGWKCRLIRRLRKAVGLTPDPGVPS